MTDARRPVVTVADALATITSVGRWLGSMEGQTVTSADLARVLPDLEGSMARVEAEIARLEELAARRLSLMKSEEDGWQKECDELKARAEAAEAEIARLKRERDEIRHALDETIVRAGAAEAENTRLRDALTWWVSDTPPPGPMEAIVAAHKRLLAEDGAAQPVTYDELRGYVHGGAMRSKSLAPGQAEDGAA